MHFSKLYKLECLLDLSISGDVFCVIRGVASGDQHPISKCASLLGFFSSGKMDQKSQNG